MKKFYFLLVVCLISQIVFSQIPYKNPSFGDDVIIQNVPDRDQRRTSFCTAFDGLQFSVYEYPIDGESSISMLKSQDDGLSWIAIQDPGVPADPKTNSIELLTKGLNEDSLKLYRLWVSGFPETGSFSISLTVWLVNNFGNYFNLLPDPHNAKAHFAAMAKDDEFPAIGASPSSLAVVYTAEFPTADSIFVRTSGDGGYNFNKWIKISGKYNTYFGKADISYGRCSSVPVGKYLTVWEEKENQNAASGNIYISQNSQGYNSSFTTPVKLNDFLVGSEGKLANPKIASQYNNTDNDKNDFTTVVLADKINPISGKSTVVGFYNDKSSTDQSNWKSFIIGDSSHVTKDADIIFNYFDSTFIVVYFDSTESRIPYLKHSMNFSEPVNWTEVNHKINNYAISNPLPQVNLCYDKHVGGVTWSGDGDTNKIAYYDAPYFFPSGIEKVTTCEIKIYPNPAISNFSVNMNDGQKIQEITIFSIEGKERLKLNGEENSKVTVSTDGLNSGLFFLKVKTEKGEVMGKIIISNH